MSEQTTPEMPKTTVISSAAKAWIALFTVFAITAVAFMTKELWGAKKAQQTDATPTPLTSTAPTASPAPSTTPKPDQNLQTSDPAVMEFTSEELGITFKYSKSGSNGEVAIKRVDNKVYVYPTSMAYTSGQYVEVFAKSPTATLTEAIQTKFLANYTASDCFVKASSTVLPAGYEAKIISTPPSDDLEEMEAKRKLCPPVYTASNGIAYFEYSTIRNTTFAYISIGQYSIAGDTPTNTWQSTLRFIALQ